MTERYAPQRVQTPDRPMHRFDEDPGARVFPGQPPLCRCGMPKPNAVHDENKVAAAERAAHDAQAEERRRLGERED